MGDNDDSSNAAHGAREMTDTRPESGFFTRLRGWMGGSEESAAETPPPETSRSVAPIHGLMNLRSMRVEDVAVPRADIVSVPDTVTKSELVDVFRESGLTRLPVYTGTLDTPVGMAHLKDLALKHGFNGKSSDFDLKQMLRPLLFVPPSMPIGVLLTKMQTERRHMALVIDEYGGVDGLVTIEDLIEQVIGEIEDEHDLDEGRNFSREKPGVYMVFARTPLEEFEAEIGLNLTDHEDIDGEEIDTLGGLVFMLAGHVPARGEVVPHPEGPEFEVIDADPRRIKRMRVRLKATAAGDAARAREAAEAATTAARSA
ncbi:hemolysin family protein [Marivita sp. XM-24bin2]|jgi:magnesium and cobalt transporter|uniref:hemolysin family protein n=1 Tax=unclassified Marivita TaxID=2632480 RepID=UPI000D79C666|nr:hemolysin family protein [Marivita sp. XM-24bin2]MCR9109451.1 hemolysin family protein [Paracoccaceae bacterium]PWL35351.1 MAG: magnesium/cobalt efflux protein [Marivita sp. XM-24bin2]